MKEMKPCKWVSIVWMVSEICHVLVVADTEILVNEPKGKTWVWYISADSISDGAGWISPSSERVFYSVCDIQSNREPKNWLRTGFIPLNDSKLFEIKIGYTLRNCPDDSTIRNCKEYLALYALHTNKTLSTDDADPGLVEYEFVDRITPGVILKPSELKESIYHRKLTTKAKGVYLAFLDEGVCIKLQNFTLSYKFCSERGRDLLTFPRTVAPASDSQLVDIAGNCGENSHSLSEDKITGVCLSSGKWNITSRVKCLCVNGFELVESEPNFLRCKACSRGTYNDGKGLNCTVIPSEPRNASVSFVNESSAVITWLPPAVTGTETDVLYDVDCRKSCTYFGEDCDDERCDSNLNALLKEVKGLRKSNLTVNNLGSFVNYTCKISAKNRVSEVAERSPFRGIANFALVNLRTKGSAPGEPKVFLVQRNDTAIHVSWELTCKNGIIKAYYLTYTRVDNRQDTHTIKTTNTWMDLSGLTPGKIYGVVVEVENHIGRNSSEKKVIATSGNTETIVTRGNKTIVTSGKTETIVTRGSKTIVTSGKTETIVTRGNKTIVTSGGPSSSQFIYIVISVTFGVIVLIVRVFI